MKKQDAHFKIKFLKCVVEILNFLKCKYHKTKISIKKYQFKTYNLNILILKIELLKRFLKNEILQKKMHK